MPATLAERASAYSPSPCSPIEGRGEVVLEQVSTDRFRFACNRDFNPMNINLCYTSRVHRQLDFDERRRGERGNFIGRVCIDEEIKLRVFDQNARIGRVICFQMMETCIFCINTIIFFFYSIDNLKIMHGEIVRFVIESVETPRAYKSASTRAKLSKFFLYLSLFLSLQEGCRDYYCSNAIPTIVPFFQPVGR